MAQNAPATKNQIQKIEIPSDVLEEMQKTIDTCVPATTKASQTLSDSLTIANGVNQMKAFFQHKDVKQLVLTMKDTPLGFLTDRDPKKQKFGNKKPDYSYEEIVEALIPCMLEGYRFTNNEINIIAGKGMPVKAGKFRKIIENESVRDFEHVVGSPTKDNGVAKMKCQARWKQDGREQTIGYGDDLCIIAVEYDQYAGLDKLIGLAESKLFSRVLTRITGKIVLEGDVVVTEGEASQQPGQQRGTRNLNVTDVEVKPEEPKELPFTKKLAEIVDNPEYKSVIASLIKEGKISNTRDKNELRTTDEETAERVFVLINRTKGFEDQEKKDAESSNGQAN